MNSVLITGGAGFIGSHLAERFFSQGFSIKIVDNYFRGSKDNLAMLLESEQNEAFEIDLLDCESIEKIKNILLKYKPKYILHYAAINGTEYFYDIPYDVAIANSIGTYNLLMALGAVLDLEHNYKPVFVFASSSELYGEASEIPTSEAALTYARIAEDRDSYSIAKQMSEFYVKLFCKKSNIEWLIFRIFNVYGPRMIGSKYGQVIPEFIQRVKAGEQPLKVIGNGEQTRSFIYIDDHVELTYRAINSAPRNEVYNIGSPIETRINELALIVLEEMGKEPLIMNIEGRKGDHNRRVPDTSKLTTKIGDIKYTSLRSGIRRML